MKTILFTLIFTILFSLSVFAQQNSFADDSESSKIAIARLEKSIPELLKKSDLPGMSIALIRNGKLVWTRGFGVKNSETKEFS